MDQSSGCSLCGVAVKYGLCVRGCVEFLGSVISLFDLQDFCKKGPYYIKY